MSIDVSPSRLVGARYPGGAGKLACWEQVLSGLGPWGLLGGWVLSLPYRTCVSCFPSPYGLGQRTGFS